MALQKLAAIAVRPRRRLADRGALIAALMAVGCGHSRQSYRPIYTTPGAGRRPVHQLRIEPDGDDATSRPAAPVSSVPVARRVSPSGFSRCTGDRPRPGRAPDRPAARPWKHRPSRDWTTNRPSTKLVAGTSIGPGRRHDTPSSAQTGQPELGLWPGPARAQRLAVARRAGTAIPRMESRPARRPRRESAAPA